MEHSLLAACLVVGLLAQNDSRGPTAPAPEVVAMARAVPVADIERAHRAARDDLTGPEKFGTRLDRLSQSISRGESDGALDQFRQMALEPDASTAAEMEECFDVLFLHFLRHDLDPSTVVDTLADWVPQARFPEARRIETLNTLSLFVGPIGGQNVSVESLRSLAGLCERIYADDRASLAFRLAAAGCLRHCLDRSAGLSRPTLERAHAALADRDGPAALRLASGMLLLASSSGLDETLETSASLLREPAPQSDEARELRRLALRLVARQGTGTAAEVDLFEALLLEETYEFEDRWYVRRALERWGHSYQGGGLLAGY